MANTYTQKHYRQSHSVPDGTAGCGVISISTNIPSLTGWHDKRKVPFPAGLGNRGAPHLRSRRLKPMVNKMPSLRDGLSVIDLFSWLKWK